MVDRYRGAKSPIQLGNRPHLVRFVGALVLLTLVVVSPSAGRADSIGGQGSTYIARQVSDDSCTHWFPLFQHNAAGWSSTIMLDNQASGGITVEMRFRPSRGEGILVRTRNVLLNGSLQVSSSDLQLGESFSGSLTLSACPGNVSAVVAYDRSGGDRIVVESMVKPSSQLFFPGVENGLPASISRVVLFNTDRSADTTATLTIRALGGQGADRTVFVPRDGTLELDLAAAPTGLLGIQVLSQSGPSLTGVALQYRIDGAASAVNPITTSERRIIFPVLYRNAGPDGTFGSVVRVMNTQQGGTQPRISFIDHRNNTRSGPIRFDGILGAGEAGEWVLASLPDLVDGRMYTGIVEADNTEPLAGVAFTRSSRGIEMGYSEVTSGHTEVSVPILHRRAEGLDSTLQVYNFSSSDSSFTIDFRNPKGTHVITWTGRLSANNTTSIPLTSVRNLPDGFVGTAKITSTASITALVTTMRSALP